MVRSLESWHRAANPAKRPLYPGQIYHRDALTAGYISFLKNEFAKENRLSRLAIGPSWTQEIMQRASSTQDVYLILAAETALASKVLIGVEKSKFLNMARFYLKKIESGQLSPEKKELFDLVVRKAVGK